MRLTLSLLGKPSVLVDNHPAPNVGTSKAQALLYYLAVTGSVQTRDELARLFWPKDGLTKAKNSLRVALVSLRKELSAHLTIDRQTVAFNTQSAHDIDVHRFDRASNEMEANPATIDIEHLTQAISLYQGDFLEDFHVDGAPAFEAWVLQERAHRRQLLNQMLDIAAHHLLEQRCYEEARDILTRQLELAPWEEQIHFALMETLSRLGDFNGALTQYQTCVNVLAQELDAEPMPETTALFQRIQAARAIERHSLPPEPTPFVGRKVELADLHATLTSPDCRLVTITGLGGMGKSRLALAAARQIYHEEALLFLNGVVYGSVGAIRSGPLFPSALAEALGINLSGGTDALTTVIDYLENKELLLVLDGFELLVQDSRKLKERRGLSNGTGAENSVEGSVPSYDEDSAVDTLNLILEDCPDVRCLVTSREPLEISIEQKFELRGLDYPRRAAAPNVESYSAVQLFLQGATQVRPTYQLAGDETRHVVALCQLLAGMPLGIKLSAAWLRAMSTQRIVEEISRNLDFLSTRMRDVDPRQRSMRAVLDYAWALLPEEARVGLASLSIFAGEFGHSAAISITDIRESTLDAIIGQSLIQTLAQTKPHPDQPRDVYPEYASTRADDATLSDVKELGVSSDGFGHDYPKNSPKSSPQRFSIHQMVHQYGLEKLKQDPALHTRVADAHSAYYVAYLEEQVTLFSSMDEMAALEAIGQEGENIRLAWNRSVGDFNPSALLSILQGVSLYHRSAGPFQEAEAIWRIAADQIEKRVAKGQVDAEAAKPILGQILVEQARFLNLMGRHDPVLMLTDQILALSEALDSVELAAPAQFFRVRPLFFRGEVDKARSEAEKGLALAQSAKLTDIELECWSMIGFINLQQNSYAEARAAYEKALNIATDIRDRRAASTILSSLGVIAVQQSDYETAQINYEDALNLSVEIGDRPGECHRLNNLARVYSEQRYYERAAAHLRHGLQIAREIGDRLVESNALLSMGRNALYVGDYATATARFTESLAIKLEMQDAHGEGEVLTYQGLLLHLQGEYRAAAQRSRAGLARTREAKSEFVINFAHTNLGHALVQLNRLNEAKQSYRQALITRQALGHRNLSTEPLAGLIDIALRQGDEEALRQHYDSLMDHLHPEKGAEPIYGTDQPFRVYWMAYQAHLRLDPAGAPAFLQSVQLLLQETLALIEDPEMKRSFCNNVAVHREILE